MKHFSIFSKKLFITYYDIETKGEVFVRIKNICPNGETKSYVLKVNIGNGNMH